MSRKRKAPILNTKRIQLILLTSAFIFSIIIIISCDNESGFNYGNYTDDRDGQIYRTVIIGVQEWFAENLNYYTDNSFYYENDSIK